MGQEGGGRRASGLTALSCSRTLRRCSPDARSEGQSGQMPGM
jgi:hypothetical protein